MAVRVLNVAEKPSVAKNVAGILSQNRYQTREGRSRYNKIFEFEYTIGTQRCMMRMTSVTGHLMELDFHDQYRRWHSCDPARLYDAPVHKFVPQDKLDIKRTLEEEARQCQWLVLWLDCDREGENIAFEVIDVCHAVNTRLNIFRAHFSSYIDREIHHAAQNLKVPDQRLADAVDARQEIDLRIGASFTRFQTMLLRDAFLLPFTDDERKLILSYGPCQFPTLGFVVERYWEIQAHVPEEFWTINCSHTSDGGTATFNWIRGRLFDYAAAVVIYELCANESTATVTKITHEEKRKYPPYPLSTVELQKRGSRYFGLTPENIMKVAEELYQTGFISYPRTETDAFSPNTDLQAIAREQQQHPVWGAYANRLLNPQENLWRNPSNGGHDDKAHPPIHPTKFSSGESNWSSAHERVYELVVRHFLACVSQPALGAQTSVEIDIAGESFVARGLAIIAKNYLEVYRFDSWGGSTIPVYDQGQQFVPTRLTLDSSFTRPPPLLTEADLLELMFQAGIGTDATMHDHIKKLLDRCYVSKDANRRLSPTNLGEALVMGYDAMGYEPWKPYLRAAMEFDMKAVSDGNKTKTQVLGSCLQEMKTIFDDTKVKKQNLFEAMELFFERSQRAVPEQQSTGEMVSRCQLCNDADMMLKKKPQLYQKALSIKSAIPHPRIMGIIHECGGKMHMAERQWAEAATNFFEAFKNYDEAGNHRRIHCLKYLVLANMLMESEVNPFDGQETKPYKNDPEILAMTNLIAAYQRNDILEFEKSLKSNRKTLMDDPFIRNYIEDLLKNIRTQVLLKLIKPYTRIRIPFISKELNIPGKDVEQLLVSLILDNRVHGHIDQVNQLLDLGDRSRCHRKYSAIDKWNTQLGSLYQHVTTKMGTY